MSAGIRTLASSGARRLQAAGLDESNQRLVEQTTACKARIKAWGANVIWDRAEDETKDYLANPDQSCRK